MFITHLSKVRCTLSGIITHLIQGSLYPSGVLLLTLYKVRDNGLRFGRGVKNKILCKKSNEFDF